MIKIVSVWHNVIRMRLHDASKILNYDKEKQAVDQKPKLTKEEVDANPEWRSKIEEPKKSKYMMYLAIGTFLFFVTAVATAYFVQRAGIDRTISTNKVAVVIQGVATADSGISVPLTIRIANRNPVSMEGATLYITYPTGTFREEDDGIQPVRREEVVFGEIKTGEITNSSITPILYGKSGEKKRIQYLLNYTASGVAQPQKVEGFYDILLREPPVLLSKPEYTTPVTGKETTLIFEVRSNSDTNIPATYVDVRYPVGFTPNKDGFSLTPSSADGTTWEIIGLQPTAKKTITVTGIIRGREGESQAVVARAFVSPTGDQADAVEIANDENILVVGQAFLDVKLLLNGKKTNRVIVSPGDEVEAVINWRNQDSAKLNDLTLTAVVTGTGLDETSINVKNNGYFNEMQKQISWDRESVRDFSTINAGKTGKVSFSFRTLPDRIEFAQEQKYVRVAVSAKAIRNKTSSAESVRDIVVGQVNLRSVLQVVENTLYTTSALQNSGPLPPQVGKATTYVLKYFVKNSGNEIANFKMTIPLGPWVELTGKVSGVASSEWKYDEANRAVEIDIPSFSAKGPDSSRSIEVQVSVTPKNEDIGRYLTLANGGTYTARDTFTDETINGSFGRLTTGITAEPTDNTRVVAYQQEVPESEKVKENIRAPQIQQ